MSSDVYINEYSPNGEYIICCARIGYLATIYGLDYNLIAALRNIQFTYPIINDLVKSEIIEQFRRFDFWMKNLSGEERNYAEMMTPDLTDYITNEKIVHTLKYFPNGSRWKIRVD